MIPAPAGPVRRMLALLAPDHRRLAAAAGVAVAAELAAVALTGTATWLVATAAGHPGIAALAPAIVAVRALATGRGVLRYVDRLAGHDAVLAALARLRATVFRALIPLAPAGTSAFRGGDLLTRLVDDVDAVADLLLRCLLPAVVCGVVGAAAVAVTGAALPAAGAVLLAGLAVAAVAIPACEYRAARRSGTTRRLRASLADAAVDLSDGAPELVAFGAVHAHVDGASTLADRIGGIERRRAPGRSAAAAGLALVQGLATAAAGLLAAGAAAEGRIGPVTAAVLPVLVLVTLEVAAPLPAAAAQYADVRSSATRLTALLDAPAPVVEPGPAVPGPTGPGRVDVRGLRARYPGSPTPALDGVDLVLEPGRRTALVGASGSGKSTLLAVLMRFVDVEDGTVLLDGRDLRTLTGDTVRRHVTGVTQDAHLFRADVRTNLLVGRPDADDAALAGAARRARVLAWVESLPHGWSTVLDPATVSGGQRQRLLLARALLADPPVLVLDEPTEGLDDDTADAVLADLLGATRDRTTLLVTHRAAGLDAVDEIVVLDRVIGSP